MQLDYVPSTRAFVLRVARGEADPKVLMHEYGLDFSSSASTPAHAMLFTREHYAACPFVDVATPGAKEMLRPLTDQIELSERKESNAIIRCPADKELWDFQRVDVTYALGRRNTLVGDQPGLGKTPVSICYANEIRAKRVLVICPANIRYQWAERIREWSTMRWPYEVYPVITGKRGVSPTAHWTIVSYDLCRDAAVGAALARGTYDLIIIDEAHYVKNIESGRTHAIFGDHTGYMRRPIRDEEGLIQGYEVLFEALSKRCGSIMALTGTPLPNRPREAYTLARGLCFESIDWMSEQSFKDRFNPSAVITKEIRDAEGRIVREVKRTVEKAGRHGELQARLRANFMVRHMKRDVLPQLKMPIYDVIKIEPDAAIRQALNAESMLDIDPDNFRLFTQDFNTMGQNAAARRLMGIAKAPLVADYINMLIDGGEEKLVVFGWHIEVMNILQRMLEKHKPIRIDGSVSAPRKRDLVKLFQSDPKRQILLGNMQSAGTGTDGLQYVAWHAIFAECSWVPGENIQAVDRLDRGGQTRTVQADFLVAPGSIDDAILTSSLRKLRETDKVLDRKGWSL
jgi:SNF2 family DNA or RNA helicase